MKYRPLIVSCALALVIAIGCYVFRDAEQPLPSNYEDLLEQVSAQDKDLNIADAIRTNNTRALLHLLHNQNAAKADDAGNTPLHLASMAGMPHMVYILLNAGLDPMAKNKAEQSPTDLAPDVVTRNACMFGEACRLRELALFNTITEGRNAEKETALQKALSHGLNPNARTTGSLDYTLLAECVRNGTPAMVRALIKAGADINAPQPRRVSLLHIAATAGRTDMVPVLISAGCEPLARMDNQATPLHNAVYHGKNATLKELVKHYRSVGFSPTAPNLGTPIEMAIQRGNLEAFKTILQAGVDPNSPVFSDKPLLIQAVHLKRINMARALLAAGADKDATDSSGKRAIDYATGPFVNLLK